MSNKPRFVGLQDAERSEISILKARGCSIREIAKALGRSPNTISYEIRKNSVNGEYNALKAKAKSRVARRSRRCQWRKIEHNQDLCRYVVTGLKAGWSPDEISGSMRSQALPFYISAPQIYAWLYSAWGQRYCQYLPSQRYRPKRRRAAGDERITIPDRTPLQQRPLGASNRSRYGHWEGDTIVSGKRTGDRTSLVVCQERKTRFITASLIPSLSPNIFAEATTCLLANKKALSLTLDNGLENRKHRDIKAANNLPLPAFFCDPYSSWQKGGIENANKMLRRYLPKGCALSQFDQAFVDAVCDRLNKKPRKILGYKSALQLAMEKGVVLERCPNRGLN